MFCTCNTILRIIYLIHSSDGCLPACKSEVAAAFHFCIFTERSNASHSVASIYWLFSDQSMLCHPQRTMTVQMPIMSPFSADNRTCALSCSPCQLISGGGQRSHLSVPAENFIQPKWNQWVLTEEWRQTRMFPTAPLVQAIKNNTTYPIWGNNRTKTHRLFSFYFEWGSGSNAPSLMFITG